MKYIISLLGLLVLLYMEPIFAADTLIYPGSDPTTAYIALHGMTGNGAQMARSTKLHQGTTATVAYPDGQGRTWGERDLPAIEVLIDKLRADGAEQIFVTGISMGAMMSMRIACRLPDISGIAPVVGLHQKDLTDCEFDTPFTLFYGTKDPLIKPGGSGWHYSAQETAIMWSGCMTPAYDPPAQGKTVYVDDYCGSQVYRIEGGKHGWPGAAFCRWTANCGINATETIQDWFESLESDPPDPTDPDPEPTQCEICAIECPQL